MSISITLLYNSDATANCDIEFDGIETSAHTTFTAWISAAAAAPHHCMARSYRPTKKGNDNEKYENG